jgi:hypothetical protein
VLLENTERRINPVSRDAPRNCCASHPLWFMVTFFGRTTSFLVGVSIPLLAAVGTARISESPETVDTAQSYRSALNKQRLLYFRNGKPVGRHLARQVVFLVLRKLTDNLSVGVIKPLEAERQLGDGQVTPRTCNALGQTSQRATKSRGNSINAPIQSENAINRRDIDAHIFALA